MKQHILVISFSPLHSDPRVRRQLFALSEAGYDLTAAGYTNPKISGVEWWPVRIKAKTMGGKLFAASKLKLGLFESYYRALYPVRSMIQQWREHANMNFDLVIANDIEALPVALKIAGDAPVFFDAHEYSPKEMNTWTFRLLLEKFRHWQCRNYLPKAAAMSTVCQGIAELYHDNFGVNPFLIFNAPRSSRLEPSPVLRKRLRMVHHGCAARSRGLETMIAMVELLDDRYELHFYLVASASSHSKYLGELKDAAAKFGRRVVFYDPVESDRIADEINQYDIGVYPLKPESVNDNLALPNKFFEFVQGRLAIAIGPSPEMARLLRKYDLGVVADDFSPEAMAEAISSMTETDIWKYKQNADKAAKELCFDAQAPVFLDAVRQLLKDC